MCTVGLTMEMKTAFSNSSGLKSVFEKLRFRGGLVWSDGGPNHGNNCFLKIFRFSLFISILFSLHGKI